MLECAYLEEKGSVVAEHVKGSRETAESDDHSHDLAVYASKGKTFLVMLLGLAATAFCVWAPTLPGPADRGRFYDTPAIGVFVQVAGGAFFGSGTIRALMVLFSPHPMLIVNHQGIFLHSQILGVGTVRWSEIEALVVYRTLAQGMLKIVPRDPRTIRARQHAGLAGRIRLLAQRLLIMSSDVVEGDGMLAMPIPALVHEIRRHFHHELARHQIQVRELRRRVPMGY